MDTLPEIFYWVAERAIGRDPETKEIPDMKDLCAWWPMCPAETRQIADSLAVDVLGGVAAVWSCMDVITVVKDPRPHDPRPLHRSELIGPSDGVVGGPWERNENEDEEDESGEWREVEPPVESPGDLRVAVVSVDIADWVVGTPGTSRALMVAYGDSGDFNILSVVDLHDAWNALEGEKPRHPLEPIIKAWQESTPAPASKPSGKAHWPKYEDSLEIYEHPTLRLPNDQIRLPFASDYDVIESCPAPLLELLAQAAEAVKQSYSTDRGGGGGRHKGLPWSFMVMVGGVVNLPDDRRGARFPVPVVDLTVDDVIAWRYPNRWRNRVRDWELLAAALEDVSRYRITVNGKRTWLVSAWGTPSVYRPAAPVDFLVYCPPGAERWRGFDFWRFVREAAADATRGKMYLALTALLDRSAKNGQPIMKRGDKQDRLAPVLPAMDLARFIASANTRKQRGKAMKALEHFAKGPDAIIEEPEERNGGLKIWARGGA